MEATHKTSRKRKQPSSATSPFNGILTRQKTQKYFFNHNRSGKSRKCRAFQPRQLVVTTKTQSQHPVSDGSEGDGGHGEDEDEEELYHISIKDLRARRVFSKPPKVKSLADLGKIENPIIDSEMIDCKLDGFGGKPSLLIGEKCGFDKGGLGCGNPNLSVLKKSDLGVNVRNPRLIESDKSDFDLNIERLNVGNLIFSQNCDLGVGGGNPNSSISAKKCDDFGVNLMPEGSSKGNPNLLTECVLGFDGGNSNLSMLERKCDDIGANLTSEGLLNDGLTNSIMDSGKFASKKAYDDTNIVSRECVDGTNTNIPVLAKCYNSGVCLKDDGLSGRNSNLIEKCGSEVDCGGNVSDTFSPIMINKDLKGRAGDSYEAMNDEIVQTTPPEAIFSIKKNDDPNVLHNRSSVSRSLTKRTSPTKEGSSDGRKNLFNSKKNMTLNLCSRLKVYKTPSSFSYRRLLPFLMNMAKDEPSETTYSPIVESEAEVKQKPSLSSSHATIIDRSKLDEMPLVNESPSIPQEMSTNRNVEVSLGPKACDGITPDAASQRLSISDPVTQLAIVERPSTIDPTTQLAASQRPNTSDPGTQLAVRQEPETSDPTTLQSTLQMPLDCSALTSQTDVEMEVHLPFDSQKGISQHEQISSCTLVNMTYMSDGEAKVEGKLNCPKGSPEASKVEFTSGGSYLAAGVGECRAIDIEIKAEKSPINLCHSSAKLAASVSSGALVVGPVKGILRRNPRGCRGICSCLNCASFRLNAEKAFEFSRNQLLETEELAQDLMKELSNLRHMLQKSLAGANDHISIPVDMVEEACTKASNMENAARSRLSQMNEDLFVHCRTKALQRPRVNFSTNVQEKVAGERAKRHD